LFSKTWTSSLGEAYHNQQADVMTAIQTLRSEAKAKGNLKTTSQIKVVQQSPQVIVIQPANPQIVYVPQYNPTVIYGTPYVTAIAASSAVADAQDQYFRMQKQYAKKSISDEGKKDGLYWPVAAGQTPSPLEDFFGYGNFVSSAGDLGITLTKHIAANAGYQREARRPHRRVRVQRPGSER